MATLNLQFFGPPAVTDAEGNDHTPKGKKAQALLAMLCTARNGSRTRAWLQANLWSDKSHDRANGNLRSCLHEIRKTFEQHQHLIITDRSIVRINLNEVAIDLNEMTSMQWLDQVSSGSEFLQGLDIEDDEFNSWLREQRRHWSEKAEMPHYIDTPQYAEPTRAAPEPCNNPDWSLSLTVLPLENKTTDSKHVFSSHGLSEDLILRLQRLRWLPVVGAGSSSADTNDTSRHGAVVAESLGAHYFVDGSISHQNNAAVCYFRLSEAESSRVIWSASYDLESLVAGDSIESVFDQIVGAIDRTVSLSMQRRVMETESRSEAFNDQIWRGRWHLARLTRPDSETARVFFEQALSLKPRSPEALVQMAFWHLWRTWVSRDGEEGLSAAEGFARRALELDPDDGRGYAVIGIAEAWRRNHDNAIAFLKQAVELNPNLAIAHHQLGSALNHADRPEDAVAPIAQAIRYSPRDQLDFAFQTEMAVALARMSDFDEAYVRASRALMQKPRYWYGHLVRLLIAHRLEDGNRIHEAQRALDHSGLRVKQQQIDWLPFRSDDWPDQLRQMIDY